MVDSIRYKEWFLMAQKDIQSAKILFEHDADLGIVCFHCQQAVEKYLKGFLILESGALEQGHNLIKLCRKASAFEISLEEHIKDCAFLNVFYIETRYPAEEKLNVKLKDATECLEIVERIIKKIEEITGI